MNGNGKSERSYNSRNVQSYSIFKAGLSKRPITNQIPVPQRVCPYIWDDQPLSFLWCLLSRHNIQSTTAT